MPTKKKATKAKTRKLGTSMLDRIAVLERLVAKQAAKIGQLTTMLENESVEFGTTSLVVADPAIPQGPLQDAMAHVLDHLYRSSPSAGYAWGGGSPKARVRGGVKMIEAQDTVDIAAHYLCYDPETWRESARPTYGSPLAYLYAAPVWGDPPIEQGRCCVIALKYGAISMRAPIQPGSSNADYNVPLDVMTFTAPVEFSGSWKGTGLHLHFQCNVEGQGIETTSAPVCLYRQSEVPADYYVLALKRPAA